MQEGKDRGDGNDLPVRDVHAPSVLSSALGSRKDRSGDKGSRAYATFKVAVLEAKGVQRE